MSFEPTPTQALLLFGLLARHGECRQAELMPAILAKDREALAGTKLIAVQKVGRSFHLTLTDAGWSWAGAHLSAALPPPHGTLRDLLARLGEHLARSGETLADFIGGKPEDAAAADKRNAVAAKARAAEEKKEVAAERAERLARDKRAKAEAKTTVPAASKKKPPAKPKTPSPTALRKRIGAAYLAITGGKKDESVKLARLRAELADLDRQTLDEALGRILRGDKKASLMRHDDPHQIDKADEAAAFSPAGEPFHVLWIAS